MNTPHFTTGLGRATPTVARRSAASVMLALALAQLPSAALAQANAQASTVISAAVHTPAVTAVEGISFEREIALAGSTLKLNGAGIRSKFVFKVYAAGLYLPATAKTSTDVYVSKGPKRLKVVFLRDTDSSSLGKTMSEVMSDNLPREQFGKCIPGLIKLGEVFANKRKMVTGEGFTMDEVPGEGTVVNINGQQVAKIAEPEFFTCLMYNYFGDKPADPKLKMALLGGQ
ncbi:MAG: chalcone isomerase family protein [Pseudomonadota bacterium]